MNFLAPGAFFLGLLLPVIVALYLLKLRRTEREVSSTYLWRRVVRDVEANAPWQKLRLNWLLILQVLFLLALIFALVRPYTWSEGISGPAAIFVFDTSASMSATDVAPNRIEAAKTRAGQLIDDLPDSARATIIAAGDEARVLLSSSLDRRQAHLAIQQVQAGIGGSDMNIALQLASAIAARQPGTEIVVLSDGRVELPEQLALKGKLRYLPFGLSGENQAISQLALEREADGSLTAFLQVSNFGEAPASRRLSLRADSMLINAYDLEAIPASGHKNIIAKELPEGTRTVQAELDGTDILALDDIALSVQPAFQPVAVRLVSDGNRFLRTALNLLPGVVLTEETAAPEQTPADSSATPEVEEITGDAPAVWIYDGTLPDQLPASGSLVFIAPPESTELFTINGAVATPAMRIIDSNDPLVANLSLADIQMQAATVIPLPAWATPVVAGDLPEGNIPLLFRGEPDGRKVVVLAFDLRSSDLPLQVDFPLLWANIIGWLAPNAGSIVPPQVTPGQSMTIRVPADTAGEPQALVTLPDGTSQTLLPENNQYVFTDTHQTGIYTVTFSGSAQPAAAFAVNAYAATEALLKPADAFPGTLAEVDTAQDGDSLATREWWRPLAFLALGLLTGEWLVYQRAALARLRDLLRIRFQRSSRRTPV